MPDPGAPGAQTSLPSWRERIGRNSRVIVVALLLSGVAALQALTDIPDIETLLEPWMILALTALSAPLVVFVPQLSGWLSERVTPHHDDAPRQTSPAMTIRFAGGGAVVEHGAGPAEPPRPRPLPVRRLSAPFPDLIGREDQVAEITRTIGRGRSVEVYGPAGIGKSTLLRHLTSSPSLADAFGSSVIFRSAHAQPVSDLLQFFFESFYEAGAARPSDAQLRWFLQEVTALIVLDDVELGADDMQGLQDALPRCGFLCASVAQRLLGKAQGLNLSPLSPTSATRLFERELGRPVRNAEFSSVAAIVAACNGHPLSIVRAAAAMRESGAVESVAPAARPALTADERRVIALLSATGGVPLRSEHVAAITELPDAAGLLQSLESRGLALSASPSFVPAGDAARGVSDEDQEAAHEQLLSYFLERARAGDLDAESPPEDLDVARVLVRRAKESGHLAEAVELGRAVESPLALTRRWGAWQEVLEDTRAAAHSAGDAGTEAWALHELGTRLVALGEPREGGDLLAAAAAMRRKIGDRSGERATRKNLAAARDSFFSWSMVGRGAIALWLVGLLTITSARLIIGGSGASPSPTASATVTVSPATQTPTQTATTFSLKVATAGAGGGTIKSAPAGIICGNDCEQAYPRDTEVTLTATLLRGSTIRWGGPCTSTPTGATTCKIKVDANVTVNVIYDAVFAPGFGVTGMCETPDITVIAGTSKQLRACFANTGTVTWTSGTATEVHLAVCCPMNTPFPLASWRVNWPSESTYAMMPTRTFFGMPTPTSIAPGQSTEFTFVIRPPVGTKTGPYTLDGGLVQASTGHLVSGPRFRQIVIVK